MNRVEIINKVSAKAGDIDQIVGHVLSTFDQDNTYCEVLFIDKSEIAKLNKDHRQIDKPTDVLSFPQIVVPSAKIRLLGSVVICPEVVEEKEESIEEVLKHGLLHLLSYDHESDEAGWGEAESKINKKC